MKDFHIVGMCLVVCVCSFWIGFDIGENNGLNQGYKNGYEQCKIESNTSWKNFVISGDNVNFYVDGEKFIGLNDTGSFGFWLKVVGEPVISNIEIKQPLDEMFVSVATGEGVENE